MASPAVAEIVVGEVEFTIDCPRVVEGGTLKIRRPRWPCGLRGLAPISQSALLARLSRDRERRDPRAQKRLGFACETRTLHFRLASPAVAEVVVGEVEFTIAPL